MKHVPSYSDEKMNRNEDSQPQVWQVYLTNWNAEVVSNYWKAPSSCIRKLNKPSGAIKNMNNIITQITIL